MQLLLATSDISADQSDELRLVPNLGIASTKFHLFNVGTAFDIALGSSNRNSKEVPRSPRSERSFWFQLVLLLIIQGLR